MKNQAKIFLIIAVAIAFIFTGWVLTYNFVFVNSEVIAKKFKEKTGLDLVIQGDVQVSLLPAVSVKIYDAYIPNGNGDYYATCDEFALKAKFWSLFSKQPHITTVHLNKPVVYWNRLELMPENSGIGGNAGAALGSLSVLENFTLEDGTFHYRKSDGSSGVLTKSDIAIQFSAAVPHLAGRLSFNKDGTTLYLDLKTDAINPDLSFNESGDMALKMTISGAETGTQITSFDLQSKVLAKPDQIPYFNGNLQVKHFKPLNFISWLDFANLARNENVVNTTDQVHKQQGLSKLLYAFKADINLDIIDAGFDPLTVDKISGFLQIGEGRLVSELAYSLYDGSGKGKFGLADSKYGPYYFAQTNINNINISKFPKSLTMPQVITGNTALDLEFQATGNTVEQLKASAIGNGKLDIKNGNINGEELPLTDVLSMIVGTKLNIADLKFNELTGSFVIKDGAVINNDLVFDSPLIHLIGQGYVSFYYDTINYKLIPDQVIKANFDNIEVPLIVAGGLSKPKFWADFSKYLAHSGEKAKQYIDPLILKRLKKNFKK